MEFGIVQKFVSTKTEFGFRFVPKILKVTRNKEI
jgi:hypothetical protein